MSKSRSPVSSRIATVAAGTIALLMLASAGRAAPPDFAPGTFKVLTPDTSTVIGQAYFDVTQEGGGAATVRSNARYNDGETDNEVDRMAAPIKGGLPRQLSFVHDFFNPDGSPDRSDKADLITGQASCTINQGGRADVQSAKLVFPADTYAGAPVMIPLRDALMVKVARPVSFHYFTCLPGPRIVAITAKVGPLAPWKYGKQPAVQVDLLPDFGWLNPVITPFLPAVRAWFDPARSWYVVGIESARYYRGAKIVMVGVIPPATSSSH